MKTHQGIFIASKQIDLQKMQFHCLKFLVVVIIAKIPP